MKLSILDFFSSQFTKVPPVVKDDLDGKTIIVTGANNGIGFEAAKHFATMNPGKLILACRNKEKGEIALEKLKAETNCQTAELWMLDLAEFASVKAFAENFDKEGGGRLDILVANAAVLPELKYEPTVDGWEPSLQVNNVSTSLLAILLLPQLIETSQKFHTTPRFVTVSSEVHYWSIIEQKVLDSPTPLKFLGSKEYMSGINDPILRYQETKLLNVLFTRAITDKLSTNSVIINAVNPGFCRSGIRAGFVGFMVFINWLMEVILARTAEEGSRQVVWAAVGCKHDEDRLRGAYISLGDVMEPSDFVLSEDGKKAQVRLWDDLIKELSSVEPKVLAITEKYLTPN